MFDTRATSRPSFRAISARTSPDRCQARIDVLRTPPFTPEDKQAVAKRVYQHIWQQSANPLGTVAA
jgi:hypothetical protein